MYSSILHLPSGIVPSASRETQQSDQLQNYRRLLLECHRCLRILHAAILETLGVPRLQVTAVSDFLHTTMLAQAGVFPSVPTAYQRQLLLLCWQIGVQLAAAIVAKTNLHGRISEETAMTR